MRINPNIFRAYDIRGIAKQINENDKIDITVAHAELIGFAFGTFVRRNGGYTVAIGKDNRDTSDDIADAFINGLLSTGCEVFDIGISITPMLYFAVCYDGYDAGCMITASHNGPQYNGFKMTLQNAMPLLPQDIQLLLNMIEEEDFEISQEKGNLNTRDGLFNDYLAYIKDNIELEKNMKIVIDCGNGTASFFAPSIFKSIGCDVEELYCVSNPKFPNHHPDPLEYKNLVDLQKKVIETKSDLGIAFDGDGDRIGVVGDDGTIYPGDMLMILLSREILKKQNNANIIIDLKSTQNLSNEIKKLGGNPILSKTGHSFIKLKMKEVNAVLGGEISGHIFFGGDYGYGYDDAIFAGAKLLETLSKYNMKIADHFIDIPKTYVSPEIKVNCDDEKKFDVVDKITRYFIQKYDCITLDGVKINFGIDKGWALIRASNTSPVLTIRYEAVSEDILNEIKNEVNNVIEKYINE